MPSIVLVAPFLKPHPNIEGRSEGDVRYGLLKRKSFIIFLKTIRITCDWIFFWCTIPWSEISLFWYYYRSYFPSTVHVKGNVTENPEKRVSVGRIPPPLLILSYFFTYNLTFKHPIHLLLSLSVAFLWYWGNISPSRISSFDQTSVNTFLIFVKKHISTSYFKSSRTYLMYFDSRLVEENIFFTISRVQISPMTIFVWKNFPLHKESLHLVYEKTFFQHSKEKHISRN